MEKLYKRDSGAVRYNEAWVEDGLLYHHWGVIGDVGEHTKRPLRAFEAKRKAISAVLSNARTMGYMPLSLEEHAILLIEFEVEGFGTEEDLEKRHALQDRMDETLGWAGIGHCDGGSCGSGTMEVCCFVVDFEIARSLIVKDLEGTQFSDYTRIYREDG